MSDAFKQWHKSMALKASPFTSNITEAESMELCGYWRLEGARTKPAYPVFIWDMGEDAPGHFIFMVGNRERNSRDNADEWQQFIEHDVGHLVAVTQVDYEAALRSGFWPAAPGEVPRAATKMDDAKRLDVIPTTPTDEGGNMSVDEAEQYDAKIKAQVEKIAELGTIDGQEKANGAAQIITDMRALWKMANIQRTVEKKPHDDAAAAVQARWTPILDAAKLAADKLLAAIEGWKKAEQRRLQREADERAAAERRRVADETAARLKAEAEARAAEAEEGEAPHIPSDDDIRARAEQVAVETVQTEVVAKPKASGTYSRAVSKSKKTVGVITDIDKFIAAIKDQDTFIAFLQETANRLARAKTALPGMKIEDQ